VKFEDFQVNTYNKGSTMRVTHLGTGVNRLSDDVTREKVLQLMNDIRDEVDTMGKPCSFAKALDAVVEQGKGMQIVGDDSVVRAQFPDQYSMSDLPYLYITSKYGRVPWSIDSFSPFATWVVVD
jgi:hypothetical protein